MYLLEKCFMRRNRKEAMIGASAVLVFLSVCLTFSHKTHANTFSGERQHTNLVPGFAGRNARDLFAVRRNAQVDIASSNRIRSYADRARNTWNLTQRHVQSSQEDFNQGQSEEEIQDARIARQNVSPTRRADQDWSSSHLTNANSPMVDNSVRKETPDCLSCMSEQTSSQMSPLTLRQLRLEMIKQQLLRKLRLREVPSTTQLGKIPDYVQKALHQFQSQHGHHETEQDDDDDFDDDGRTEQIIVFPEKVQFPCDNFTNSTCLKFVVPKEIHKEKVSSAELWIYGLLQSAASTQLRFSTSSVSTNRSQAHVEELRPTQHQNEEPWLKLNFTQVVSNWRRPDFTQIARAEMKTLHVACDGCLLPEDPHSATVWGTNMTSTSTRPFLVVNMDNSIKKRRSRRSINCRPGVNQCCREHLEVDFEEFAWNWIIEPKKYHAYFCKGSCWDDVGNFHNASHLHAVHREKIIAERGLNNETRSLLPCCAATKMTGISILYVESNGTALSKYVPNMVVESCGCH